MGLAKYLNLDPTLIRVVMGLLVLADGVGILIYIVMAVIVPLKGSTMIDPKEVLRESRRPPANSEKRYVPHSARRKRRPRKGMGLLCGDT